MRPATAGIDKVGSSALPRAHRLPYGFSGVEPPVARRAVEMLPAARALDHVHRSGARCSSDVRSAGRRLASRLRWSGERDRGAELAGVRRGERTVVARAVSIRSTDRSDGRTCGGRRELHLRADHRGSLVAIGSRRMGHRRLQAELSARAAPAPGSRDASDHVRSPCHSGKWESADISGRALVGPFVVPS